MTSGCFVPQAGSLQESTASPDPAPRPVELAGPDRSPVMPVPGIR